MISMAALSQLDQGIAQAVASAVLTIQQSGVIEIQRSIDMQRILSGPGDEPAEELANRILEHRKSQYALDAFSNLALELKELTNA